MAVTIIILLLLTILLSLLVLYIKKCQSYWCKKGVYVAFRPNVIFGNVKSLLTRECEVSRFFKEIYDECKRNYKKMSGFYFLSTPGLVIADTDLIKSIMNSDFEYFTDRQLHSDKSDPLSEHIGSIKGDTWKKLRLQLTPSFSSAKVKAMFGTVESYTNELITILDKISMNDQMIKLNDVMNRFCLDVIGCCTLGVDCNCINNPNSKFEESAKKVFDLSIKDSLVRLLSILCPDVLSMLKVRSVRKDIAEFFSKTISENIKFRKETNVVQPNFMDVLVQARKRVDTAENHDGTKIMLTDENIVAHCVFYIGAGFEAIGSTICFCLHEMSVNTNIQQKARMEVIKTLAKYNNEFCYESVKALNYIEKCIKETLRKYSSIPIHMRVCTKPYAVPGTNLTIEKGTPIFVPIHGIHMDPNIYHNPKVFDPERFSNENISNRFSYTWFPFGYGPRECIGKKFVMMEIKTCIAKLLLNFEFTTNCLTDISMTIDPKSLVTKSKNGVWLNIKKIN